MAQGIAYDNLIPAFRFEVAFVGNGPDASSTPPVPFSEVSGLSLEIQTEDIQEGGNNGYTIRLPKPPRMKNLVLRRAMSAVAPDIISWARKAVENFDFEPRTVIVRIKDYEGNEVKAWNFENAYPVKLSISDFSASKNEVVIETMELAYRKFRLM